MPPSEHWHGRIGGGWGGGSGGSGGFVRDVSVYVWGG